MQNNLCLVDIFSNVIVFLQGYLLCNYYMNVVVDNFTVSWLADLPRWILKSMCIGHALEQGFLTWGAGEGHICGGQR